MILTGIRHPIFGAVLGFAYFIARCLYTAYMSKAGTNSKVRTFGAVLGDILILLGLIGSIKVAIEIILVKWIYMIYIIIIVA